MIIPGILIAVLTFPGVIVHEFAHLFFCKMFKIPVLDVKFFQFDMKVSGYVLHEKPDTFTKSFMISLGPFIINTLLCVLICFPAAIGYSIYNDKSLLTYFLLWLGVSIGMHAFPSKQDSSVVLEQAMAEVKKMNPLAIVGIPLFALFFLANILSIIWFDALFGIAVGIWLPVFIFNALI